VRYLYSGSEDGTVKIFDLRSPSFSRSFDCKAPVNCVAHHPTRNEIVSGDQSGAVKVWDLNSSKCINEIVPDAFGASSSSLSLDPVNTSTSAAANTHANAHTNANANAHTNTHANNTHANPDNSSTSSSSSLSIQSSIQSPSTGERASIQSVDISDDGRTCIAANNHSIVFLWDPTDSTNFIPLSKFRAHPTGTYLTKAKISPDCRQLVTCSSDQTAKLFDITRPQVQVPVPVPAQVPLQVPSQVKSNPSGGTNTNGTCTNTAVPVPVPAAVGFTPTLTLTLAQHQKWVWDAVFSADSSYLVTASSDNIARLFNLRTGEVVRQYEGHQFAVTCVALNDSST